MKLPVIGSELCPENLLALLEELCDGVTQQAVASALGVSPQYLCDVLKGRREVGPAILDSLNLEKVVTYKPKEAQ